MSKAFILRNQRIPETQKTPEWDIAHVYDWLSLSGIRISDQRTLDQIRCWRAYQGIDDDDKERSNNVITRPYGLSLGVSYTHYPLIEGKVEQILGEYLTRPIKKKTYVINKAAKSKKLAQMHGMIAEDILRDVNKDLEVDLGFTPDSPNPEQQLPPDVQDFIENDYKTESEEVSDIILEQVLEVKNNKDAIKDLLVDFLVQDEAISYIDEKDGHPCFTRENKFESFMDWNPTEEIQKNPQWFIRTKYLRYNEILNDFDLSEKEIQILDSYMAIGSQHSISRNFSGISDTGYDSKHMYNMWFNTSEGAQQIRAIEMIWLSKRELKVRVSKNKHTGKEIYKTLPQDSTRKGADIKSIWVDYKRKVLMVGPDLILSRGPVEERYGRVDDIKKDTIPVVAIRRNNFLQTRIRSLAMKLLQLQDFASETLFEMRLAMRRNTGKVMVYDSAQIPKQFLKAGGYQNALNRVLHHAKKDQMLIINSQDKATRHAFNQFTALDMGTRGQLQDLINMLTLIESLADKFVGLSPERQGQVDQYQTAQGAERAVAQSTARTEVYISPFESFIEAILEKVLMKGKYVYEENQVVEYLFGDIKNKFFKVYPAFFQDDIGVSVGNNFRSNKTKGIIDNAASMLFQSAQTPELILNLIEVLDSDSANDAKKILKRGIAAMEQIRKENNEAMQAAEKTKQDGENTRFQAEQEFKQKELDNDILIAEIQNNSAQTRENSKQINENKRKLADIEAKFMSEHNSN